MHALGKITKIISLLYLTVLTAFAQLPPSINYTTPNIYPINTPVTPLQPTNTGGAVPAGAYGNVTTFAGTNVAGNTNGNGRSASFNAPVSAATDALGNVYIADSKNYQVRKITPGGAVSVLAGSGVQGNADGQGLAASFTVLTDITIGKDGNLYVVDGLNNSIRKITPTGDVTTPVNGLSQPYGIVIDATGNIFVSQPFNHVILKITPGGVKSVFAGSGSRGSFDGKGTFASFNQPTFMVIDAAGNIIVADAGNSIIRKINPDGTVVSFAGNRLATGASDGKGFYASFNFPNGLAVDALGNIYVADTGNNLIRRITPEGEVITVAGGAAGNVDDVNKKARFSHPLGVAVNAAGELFVADYGNNNIRKVQLTGYTLDKDLPTGLGFDPRTGIITGTPTVAWPRTRYKVTAYNLKGESSAILNIEVKPVPLPTIAPPKIAYTTPNVYTINKTIPPLKPTNTGGEVPATVYGTTTIFAGNGQLGGTDGSSNTARFTIPYGLTMDADGNVFVAEGVSRMRQIKPDGFVTTIATDGMPGAPFNVPKFNTPKGVVKDAAGNLFIANYGNHNILKVTPDGIVSVFAGGAPGGGYKDGQGTAATITWPSSIAIDAAGTMYVTDYTNRIRKISPSGYVYTFAGNGTATTIDGKYTASSFNTPAAIAVDAAGNLYVAEQMGNVIRKVTPFGDVTTLAGDGKFGTADGTGTAARFGSPFGMAIDKSGNLYVTQFQNGLIRKVTPEGVVTTVAGGGIVGKNEGAGSDVYFNAPTGIVIGPDGNLYVADAGNYIKKVLATGYTIDKPLPTGLIFDVTTGIITGTPLVLSPATDYKVTAYNGGGSSSFLVNIKVTDEVVPLITSSPVTGSISNCEGITSNAYQQFSVSASGLSENIKITPPVGFVVAGTPAAGYDKSLYLIIKGDGVKNINVYVKPDGNLAAGTYVGNVVLSSAGAADVLVPVSAQVSKVPMVNPVANQPGLCSGTRLTLGFTGTADVYSWTNSNTDIGLPARGTGNLSFITQNNGNVPITATITVMPNSSSGLCTGVPVTFTITVTPLISPIVNIKQVNVTCPGQLVTFNAAASNAGTNPAYQWQVNGSNAGSNNTVFSSSTLLANDLVTCTVTNTGNSCRVPGLSNTLKVFYAPDKAPPTVSIDKKGDVSGCAGADLTFTAIAVNEGVNPTYQWLLNGLPVANNSGKIYVSNKLENGDRINCVVINNDGCRPIISPVSEPANIVIEPLQVNTVTINSSLTMPICALSEVTFTPTPSTPMTTVPTYTWYVNGTKVSTEDTFTTRKLINGDLVHCIMTSYDKCATPKDVLSNTIKIINKPALPAPSVSIGPSGRVPSCTGVQLMFTAVGQGAGSNPTYQWKVNGQPVNNQSNIYVTGSLAGGDKVTCVVINNDGCTPVSSPVSEIAEIITTPTQVSTVTISASVTMPVCGGKEITFTPTPANYQTSAGLPTYAWYVNSMLVSDNDTYTTKTLADGDQVYCLMTTYGNCVAPAPAQSNIIDISFAPETGCIITPPIVVPNAFTPNGDGHNDTWNIPALANYPGCIVSVFNRHGISVFRSVNYTKAWNGNYNNNALPSGTYYYIIDPKNGGAKLSGYVVVIR